VFVWKRWPGLVPVLLLGCQGMDRNPLQERLNDGSIQSPDAAIAEARGLQPQLKFPCRIAVYLKPGGSDWRWTPEDKAAMQQWAAALVREGIASDVFPLPELVITSDTKDVKGLRLAAAKCGADALFVIHASTQTESSKNFATVLDYTIIGGYIVPASHRDSLFLLEGVLLDVDNGYIYTAVQAEGQGKIMRPTFVIEDKDAVVKAKAKAMTQFGEEVLGHMRALAAMPPTPRPATIQTVEARTKATPILGVLPGAPPGPGGVMTGITIPKPAP
jgi:hypothetical protein